MEDSQKKVGFLRRNRKFFALLVIYFTFFMLISTFMLVKLNQPAGKVKVPNVTGKNFNLVYNTLVKKELKPVIKFLDASDVDNGLILKQYPDPGKIVPRDSRVKLVVSRNSLKIDVPELTGNQLIIAKNKLKTLNIGAKKVSLSSGVISYVPSAEHAENIVISQSPKVGEMVFPNSKVNLLVSMGSLESSPKMPVVTGQHIDLCFDLLLSLGLEIKEEIVPADTVEDSGKIMEQSIVADADLKKGDQLVLKVAYFERENHYFVSYEKIFFVIPKNKEASRYEVWVEDDLPKRVRFSRVCEPGEKVSFVLHRTGNARIEIIREKEKEKVLSIDADTF